MVTPTISPPEAATPQEGAQSGCTANLVTAINDSGTSAWGDIYNYNYYRFTASEVEGWEFDHFEYVQVETSYESGRQSGSHTVRRTIYRYSCEIDGSDVYFPRQDQNDPSGFGNLFEGSYTWDPSTGIDFVTRYSITSCVAVFRNTSTRITINVSVSPASAASDGCVVDPTTTTKTGSVGTTSESFEIEATASGSWRFTCWKDDDGAVVSTSNPYSFTKTFQGTDQTFDYKACFETGEILYDGSSGKIICGSSGSILFKG